MERSKSPVGSAALEVLRSCGAFSRGSTALLAGYYLLTPVNALVDGLSWLLLVQAFATGAAVDETTASWLVRLLEALGARAGAELLLPAAAFLLLKGALTFLVLLLESLMDLRLRRTVQERCYSNLLHASWIDLQRCLVGRSVGALTVESTTFAKYALSFVRAIYAVISAAILTGMAFLMAPSLSLGLLAVGGPAWLILRRLYGAQTGLSTLQARARQDFAADVTERLHGLFQIKAAGDVEPHLEAGLRTQPEMARLEILLAYCGSAIASFNTLILAVVLLAYALWTRANGASGGQIQLLGGVGILGLRAVSQLNILIGALGNLTRLSGCVEPIRTLALLAPEPRREPLPEPLAEIRLEDAGFSYAAKAVLPASTLGIRPGRTFLITGPSGAGKTTLANVIAGLYTPSQGRVLYQGVSGKTYDSRECRPRIGYVTQDVHLFRGSVRDNLDPLRRHSDEDLRRSLQDAGAAPFVESLGGLDAAVAEAGRAFSGGEKRRLAIACALAQRPDALILDEVTSGLDDAVKRDLLKTIARLGRDVLVIAISHDLAAFSAVEHTRHILKPPREVPS